MNQPSRNNTLAIVGCGRLGLQLAELLRANSAPPHIIGTTTTAARLPQLEAAGIDGQLVRCDEESRLHEILLRCRSLVLTLAPRAGRDYRQTYADGVSASLAAAKGTALESIVYTSSISVYGARDGSWVDENTPPEPIDDNGRALLAAEQTLLEGAAQLGVAATVLRLAGLYSTGGGPLARIAALAGTARTDGESYLNLVHRDDVVTAIALALANPPHGVLNINDDAPTRRRHYYDQLLAHHDAEPIRWIAPPGEIDLDRGKRVRNQRAKEILGWEPSHPKHLFY